MHGAEIQATFGSSDVIELEQAQTGLDNRLTELLQAAEAEEDWERAEELRAEAGEVREELTQLTHKLRSERSKFTDIAAGRKVS